MTYVPKHPLAFNFPILPGAAKLVSTPHTRTSISPGPTIVMSTNVSPDGMLVTLAFVPAVFLALALVTRLATPALLAGMLAVLAGGLVVRPVAALAPPALAALPSAAAYALTLALAWGLTGTLLFRSRVL